MRLSDQAVLVQLNISQWTARKFDRKVTKDVADSHGATTAVGRFNKSLLPASDLLSDIHKKTNYIRNKYYENTLPWGIEGTQLLPSANYLAFMTDFRKEHSEWNHLVSLFVQGYPQLKRDAKSFLPGGLYNESEYPDPGSIYTKFKMDLAVFPVPTSDFRTQISESELENIRQDVEARVQQASQTAMQDVWQRLYDRVKHIAEKLADPKAVFRDSMLEHTQELCALLPRLNFTDDPALEAMRRNVEQSLANHHPDALRNDPVFRSTKAAEAQKILDAMTAHMGSAY